MSGFEFEGYKDGRKIKGYIGAETEKMAITLLKGKGIVVYSLRCTTAYNVAVRRLSDREVADFISVLLDYVSSGIPVLEALTFMGEESADRKTIYIATFLRDRVKEGESLSSAMVALGRVFDETVIGMVAAGESGGKLTTVLSEIAEMYSKRWDFKRKIASAMIYPSIVFGVSMAVVVFLISFVVPKIVTIFKSSETHLPMITRLLLLITEFLSCNAAYILVGILVVIVFYWAAKRTRSFRRAMGKLKLRFPIVGKLERDSILYIYMLTLSSLLESGVLVEKALGLSAGVVSNLYVREILEVLSKGVVMGKSLSDVMREAAFFPKSLIYMVAMGERSGSMEEVLKRVVERYRTSVEEQIHRFVVVFEPIMILVVGGIVGFIVISILLPILSMSTLVR